VKRALRTKSVGTKVSEAELRVLESRAGAAGLTLSEWVRDVLLGSSVDAGTMAAERAILAEMLAMRAILLNFLLKLSMRQPITEQVSRELITWADWKGSCMRIFPLVLRKVNLITRIFSNRAVPKELAVKEAVHHRQSSNELPTRYPISSCGCC